MEKRTLGRTGIDVSALGLGCMRLCPKYHEMDGSIIDMKALDEDYSLKCLHAALDMGVNLFDTSNGYGAGSNEKLLGRAFVGRRDQVVIVTKFGNIIDEATETQLVAKDKQARRASIEFGTSPEMIKWMCEQSLRRLNTDYIDLFLCHPGNGPDGERMIEPLEELVKEGKIRSYGWSTDLKENALSMIDRPNCAAMETGMNVVKTVNEIVPLCEKHSKAALIRSPLGGGIIGKMEQDTAINGKINAVKEILISEGRTVVQGALSWLWAVSPSIIPIPGFRTIEQLEGLIGAMNYSPLSEEQMKEIKALQ